MLVNMKQQVVRGLRLWLEKGSCTSGLNIATNQQTSSWLENEIVYSNGNGRKCGKVVCATCSPHRITIPRQFIVNPRPTSIQSSSNQFIFTTRSPSRQPENGPDDSDDVVEDALDGGVEVRICNPCVPDPNYSLPPQQSSSTRRGRDRDEEDDAGSDTDRIPLSMEAWLRANRPGFDTASGQQRTQPAGSRHSAGDLGRHLDPSFVLSRERGPARYASSRRDRSPSAGMSTVSTSMPTRPTLSDDDYCPVCRRPLPPQDPDGGTTFRDSHVQDCITSYFASVRPADAVIAAEGSTSSTRHPQRELTTYEATEKDGVGECSICFEDFTKGNGLALLDCLCKYHLSCILGWWDKKGKRVCPVHDHAWA
ncbi:MAG: hypothetical protein M1825_004051 [Sarcosagium campestre]|nr:MAG: hypothetical protein M1825_004051 [Sarcosagium campestre]